MRARNALTSLLPLLTLMVFLPGPAPAADLWNVLLAPGRLTPVENTLAVRPGAVAPDFALPGILVHGSDGKTERRTFRLSDYRGRKNVVLSFVPAAFTPVCTSQWPGYNLAREFFDAGDAVLLGISTDNLPSLHAWLTEMGGLWFPALSDFWPHGAVAKAYGVLRSDGTAERAIVVIDKQGVVRYAEITDINTRPNLESLVGVLRGLGR
jgi:peroxiredoxin